MSSQVRLRLLPGLRCMFDESVQVQVSGLRSRQVVTVRARATDERGEVFSSSATYKADGSGEVHLDRDPALNGSYVGVEPMGLLWSMRASTLHKYFFKNNALKPHVVKFSVHEEEKEEAKEGRILAEATNERLLMGEGVTRVPVKEGNISGVLFIPAGEGPFPAVLDVCTFMSEKRASLLANRGFLTLTVAVFNDKAARVTEIHLDYFEEAADFLRRHPKAGSKGIGVVSRSKGGDIALSMAAFLPGIDAVVWINGSSANGIFPLVYRNKQILSALKFDLNKVIETESGAKLIKYTAADPLAEESRSSLVPIEKARGRFLFMASEDDLNWDSKGWMEEMVERLKRHGKNNHESVCYLKAGHLLEPPYGPFCPSATHGVLSSSVLWGGEPSPHAAAEVQMWKKMQEFFRAQLPCDAARAKL